MYSFIPSICCVDDNWAGSNANYSSVYMMILISISLNGNR